MDKRAGLRQFYQTQEEQAVKEKRFQDRTQQLASLEGTLVQGLNALISFLDGKTTKTEVVNQLKSIATPDVDKVVKAVERLDSSVVQNKVDLKPLESLLTAIRRELSLIPKTHAEIPEAREDVRVTNLSDVKLDTSALEKAVKALKLDPKIDVKAPDVQVNTDLKPIQGVLLDVLKAVNNIKLEVPEFPEIPATDLAKVEKKLDESNKHLKAIVDKPVARGGGGGGNGTPYVDDTGKASYVTLDNGAIPITGSITASSSTLADFSVNDIEEDTTSYFGNTKPDATWLIKKVTDTSVSYATENNNGSVTSYTDAWTDRATLNYGRFDEAF